VSFWSETKKKAVTGVISVIKGQIIFITPAVPQGLLAVGLREWWERRGGAKEPKEFDVATLSYSSLLHSGRILSTQKLSEDFINQYPNQDIQLIKIPISYYPESPKETDDLDWNKHLKAIDVQLEFVENANSDEMLIQVADHFPTTAFSDLGWTIDAHVGVGFHGSFTPIKTASANADGKLGVHFSYKPLKAVIISEGLGNAVRWTLEKDMDEYPIGQKDYYVTVRIPRELKRAKAELRITLFLDRKTDSKLSFGPFPIDVEFGESR